MHNLLKVSAAAIALAISTTAASAAENVTVPAGRTTGLGFIYFATNLAYGCNSSGRAKVRIIEEPEHGKVHTEWRKLKADFKNGCKGKTMNGLAVWYTPDAGYTGTDTVRVGMSVPGIAPGVSYGGKADWTYKITVVNAGPATGKSKKKK